MRIIKMFNIDLPPLLIGNRDLEDMDEDVIIDRLNIARLSDVLENDWFPLNVALPVNLPELIMKRVKDNQSFYEIHNDLSEYIYSRYTKDDILTGLPELIDAGGWE